MIHLHRSEWIRLAVGCVIAALSTQVLAASTDIAPIPIAGTGQASPKPNVMLLMDTSKSMAFTHMPDEVETADYVMPIGYRSSQCNSLYYDPNKAYKLPKKADNMFAPAPTWPNARYDFYSATNLDSVDLSTSFRAYDVNTRQIAIANTGEDRAQPAYYYVYTKTDGTTPASLDYTASPCTDREDLLFAGIDLTLQGQSAVTTGGRWTRKLVTAISGTGPSGADERSNFAVWYSYYRTRMAMVKSSVGTAFSPLTDKFRIGFVSMNPLSVEGRKDSGVAASKYLRISDFDPTQRFEWFSKVNAQVPSGSSPAREGLARVGRHFAGKMDGINLDMGPDPVSNSCQQNFTIMTTDGYWNTAAETVGPVGLDGETKVGNTDGLLTPKTSLDRFDATQYSHRPIWDGTTSGTRTDKTQYAQYRYANCNSGQFYKSTSLVKKSTTQTLQRVQSLTMTTSQVAMSTSQTSMSTSQAQKTTTTATKQTLQQLASTQQTLRSTRQELQTTRWWTSGTQTILASTSQNLQTTSYTEQVVTKWQSRTVQNRQTVSRMLKSTSQVTAATSQLTASTSQNLRTQTTYALTTSQPTRTTLQNFATTTRRFERTSQLVAFNGSTEQATPVATCTNTGNITCLTLTTGPTAVASCTPQTASSSNNYLARTCDTPQVVGPTPVQSCTNTAASSANAYTQTACTSSSSGPTAVASCTAAAATADNSWTSTTCGSNTTGPVQTAVCSPGYNSSTFVTTSCAATVLSRDTPVQSCTGGTSGTTATTCRVATTTNVPVQSCNNTAGTSSNGWVTTTCNTLTTPPTGVQSCSSASPSAANQYTRTTCDTVTTPPTGIDSCTASSASAGNNWTSTTCTADSSVAAVNPVASCTNNTQTPTAGNGWIKKTCAATNGTWTNAASCTTVAATSANNYTATQCQKVTVSAAKPVASCTPGTSGVNTTTCTPVVKTDEPVSTCTPNTTGPTFVSCRVVKTGPTAVASCTPGGGSNTNWVITTCNTVTSPQQNVQTCTPAPAAPSNGNVTTICNQSELTIGVPPGSCHAQTASASNNWVTTECPAPLTTGPTPVPLNSCVNVAPSGANVWTATTCATTGPTTPTPVASCQSGTDSSTYVVTTCSSNNSAVEAVTPGTCTNTAASAGNQFTRTACTTKTTTVGVTPGSCTAQTPSSSNGFTSVACKTVNTGPIFVAAGTCSSGTDNNQKTTTCNTVETGPTLVAACTPGTDSDFKVTSCNTTTTGPVSLAPTASCQSEVPSASNNFTTKTCTPSDVSTGVAGGSCVASAPGVLPIVTCSTVTTPPAPAASCTGGTDANFMTTTCTPEVTGPERTASCTAAEATEANGFLTTTCQAIPGTKVQTKTRSVEMTYTVSGTTTLGTTGVPGETTETDWGDVAGGLCYVEPQRPPAIDLSTDWKQTGTVTGTVDPGTAVKGSVNSLADVAQYYYTTDLRPNPNNTDPDPWANNVPKLGSSAEDDRAPWQHMTTFVIGLGVSGTLDFSPDYKTATSGTFSKIRSYENTPAVNWPVWPTGAEDSELKYSDPRSIDDFWHTAVNGRGKFFSAKDPDSVVKGLTDALAGIEAQAGAGAGAATSSLTPVAGDSVAYTGSFTTSDWTGDLLAQEIDLTTGRLSSTIKWAAGALLDLRVGASCDTRKIYARNPASGALVNFSWNTYSCNTNGVAIGSGDTGLTSAMQAYFSSASTLSNWSQYPVMTDGSPGTVDQRTPAKGANLVNFIRGQKGLEGFVSNDVSKLYRTRPHVLGDIVSSQPVYVKAPNLNYQDTGYLDFKSANAARTPMVYVGANDGMLHAFYAPVKDTDPNYAKAGQEAWAFIPEAVMPKLWKLADSNYSDKHMFTVDGSATVGDVHDSSANAWKTIIVGGLNAGGSGYYALDITSPDSPKALWEFNAGTACVGTPVGASTDCNLGLTFGRPVITKLRSGKWVVMVTSGYNNVSNGGDGKGYLYVLDAITGAIISRISTGVGDTSTPSGLREINFFVNNIAYDNTAQRVYGADVLGNIWRFDINDVLAPAGIEAVMLGTTKDSAGNRQPITTRPELAEVSGDTMVFVATGKMLAAGDLIDTSVQSVYGLKDPLTGTSPVYPDLRAALKPLTMKQTGTFPNAFRTIGCDSATVTDCSGTNGWFIDLIDSGERVNVDMQTVLGTLVFASNVPNDTLCAAGGYSWLNYVNLITGEAVGSSEGGRVSVPFFDTAVTVGLGIVGLPDGTFRGIGIGSGGEDASKNIPVGSPAPVGKRISWREITQ